MIQDYKAIFFDAGGTLFRPFPSVGHLYGDVASRYGCKADAEEIEESFHEVWSRRDKIGHLASCSDEKREKDWWREVVFEVFKNFGGISSFDPFFEELYELFTSPHVWELYPEVREVLDTLKARNIFLGIISNWDSRLLKLCQGLTVDHYFDVILISAIFGVAKPNPKIFEEALRKINISPHEAIHVGDSLEDDVKGAERVGMKAVWVDRSGREDFLPHSMPKSVHVIQNLGELLK